MLNCILGIPKVEGAIPDVTIEGVVPTEDREPHSKPIMSKINTKEDN